MEIKMREYIASKRFYSGELNIYIEKDERLKFDGVRALIRGDEKKAPTLMSAVKAHWLEPVAFDAMGKAIEEAPAVEESAADRAARLKTERLAKLHGVTGNGEFIDDVAHKFAKPIPRPEIPTPAVNKEPEPAPAKREFSAEIIHETEGVEVAKVKTAGLVTEETDTKGFYEALLDGEKKKLPIENDQFTPVKSKVIKVDNQSDAVEVKKLTASVGEETESTPSTNPLKSWKSMTAKKKESFIKKEKDSQIIKKIINDETGSIKRKAQERLDELEGRGSGVR